MAYIGFNRLVGKLKGKGIRNPRALAAALGRKKYGAKRFQQAAARGKSLRGARPLARPEPGHIRTRRRSRRR